MKVLSSWSSAVTRPAAKIVLIAVAALATIALGPISAWVAYDVFVHAHRFDVGMALLGVGGVLGLAGAWLRLLLPARYFQASQILRCATAVLLASGCLAAALLFALSVKLLPSLDALYPAFILGMGIFLLGATFGETANPRSAP